MTKSTPTSTCTAFDASRRLAAGAYADVALAVRAYLLNHAQASVLIFDDQSGREIDFDMRGSDDDVTARIAQQFDAPTAPVSRAAGRPKLGVVSREVTLMPRHWEWLAAQPGGASATLRRLVETAAKAAPDDRAVLRSIQDRTYRFMSAMAGNLPRFEEASRTLFANRIEDMEALMAGWPDDIRAHVIRLYEGAPAPANA